MWSYYFQENGMFQVIVILKVLHWCVFWILPCNGSLFERMGLEEGSSPVLLLFVFKWLCKFGTRAHVQLVTTPTLAVPCPGWGTFPLHVEPQLWLCDLGMWCPTPLSPGDGPWESSMRRFNFVHVFQHKPYLSVGVSGVAQTCFVPCLEEIRRSALAFPECHQAQQSCADPDCERDITKILTDFLSPC